MADRIVINQALMQKRRERPVLELDRLHPSAETLSHPALTTVDGTERHAARSDLRRVLERAVAELSDEFRLVFVLREVEGMTGAETAVLLQIPEDMVGTRLHRAKAKLRAMLDRGRFTMRWRAAFLLPDSDVRSSQGASEGRGVTPQLTKG